MTEDKLHKACELKKEIDGLQQFLDECYPNYGIRATTEHQVQYLHGECKSFVLGYLKSKLDTLKKEFNEL